MRDRAEPVATSELKNYLHRVIVASSRGYVDYDHFSLTIFAYLKEFELDKKDVCFIIGDAPAGSDVLTDRFCREHDFKWAVFAPKWDDVEVEGAVVKYTHQGRAYNALARYWQNEEMAEVGTRLITFYDGVSSGTRDMMDRMIERLCACRVVLVTIEK